MEALRVPEEVVGVHPWGREALEERPAVDVVGEGHLCEDADARKGCEGALEALLAPLGNVGERVGEYEHGKGESGQEPGWGVPELGARGEPRLRQREGHDCVEGGLDRAVYM